jgi:hypothetical protein
LLGVVPYYVDMAPDRPATGPEPPSDAADIVIAKGKAQATMISAVGKLTEAVLTFERISLACAATLDHHAKHVWTLPDAARVEPGRAEPQVRAALETLRRSIVDFESLAMAMARALDSDRPPPPDPSGT